MSLDISNQLIDIAERTIAELKQLHIETTTKGVTVTLDQARKVLAKTSEAILALFHLRQIDSGLIAETKKWWDAILDMTREFVVIDSAWQRALEVGLDPNLSKTLMWLITAMSKEVQRVTLKRPSVFTPEKLNLETWRANLLALTKKIAPHYANYGEGFSATKITHEEELLNILKSAQWLSGVAVDLWTANGYVARALGKMWNFSSIHGYDISPEMVREANTLKWTKEHYSVLDIAEGIPHEDGSVDFLVASLGSAWEVHPDILKEVSRVLKKWWKAYLSFYNKDAFAHKAWQPQMNTLEIVYNPLASIVEVPVWNDETKRFDVFKIPALSKSANEVRQEAQVNWLTIDEIQSFPLLIASVSPSFFQDEGQVSDIVKRDRALWTVEPFSGYYLNVLVRKD